MSLARRRGRAIHWAEAFGLSALVHVGMVVFVIDFVRDLELFAERPEIAPDILVTSLVLDQATLADIDIGAGAGGLEEVPDTVEPDTLTATDPESDALEPVEDPADDPAEEIAEETPEELEPETPEPVEPEVEEPAPVELETELAEAVEPEALTPETVEPEPLAAETLTPEPEPLAPVAAAPATPEPLSPLRPDDDELAALAPAGPERLAPSAPAAAPVAVAPVRPSAPTVAATAPRTQTVAPVSATPRVSRPAPVPAAPPPPPGSPQAVVAELISKIRAQVGDPCLVALPRQASDGAPELVMVAADEGGIGDFAAAVLADIDPRPGQRGVLVDPRQCAALTFLRENASYPAFRLTLGLTEDVLPSGEELSGAVGRAAGRYVSLLLVDDNGVVQDLGTWLSFAGEQARFSIPMRRDGAGRDTSQLLIALATNSRPATLNDLNGQLAADFFPALSDEVGNAVAVVMIPFDVR